MKYHTLSDGNHTEGIGALLQYQLFCYAFCKINKYDFEFEGFKNLQHYQYTNQTQEQFSNTVTEFCGLKPCNVSKQSVFLSPSFLMNYGQSNIEKVVPIINELQVRPISEPYFNFNKFNVAVHVRVFSKTDCDPSPVRECFDESNKNVTLNYYKSVVEKINKHYLTENIVYHIYSQGDINNFHIFNSVFNNLEYHIDQHPIISLYHMMKSKVLVMSNSSLSYVAHLYGTNKCIAKPSFYHTLYSHNILQ